MRHRISPRGQAGSPRALPGLISGASGVLGARNIRGGRGGVAGWVGRLPACLRAGGAPPPPPPARWLLVVLLPVVAAAAWGVFAVPDDPSRSGAAPVAVPGPV
ncbi:DUF2568 domain-containing protein, partial [Nocardia carnea]|uniref:DUF2568 domain-containing protein n=1 Tax=Nocardia carnea TaxID=37328 RepID=UPI0024573B80